MAPADRAVLREMNGKIQEIERLARELSVLGEGLPVIEKNTRNILSAIYILKFGVSDIVEPK
jgi:hypothetical protein